MRLTSFLFAPITVLTVLATPNNPAFHERDLDASLQLNEGAIRRRAAADFYAADGACLLNWANSCNSVCKNNIREGSGGGSKSCKLKKSEIATFDCWWPFSMCKCYCA